MFPRATMVLVGGWMSLLLGVQVFPAEPAADPLTTHDPRLYLLIDDGWIADHVRRLVTWKKGGDLADLTGQAVAIELEFEGPVVVYALALSD